LQEREKELERGSACDIREQEDEPYFNPEFRGGFIVVFLWRRLSLSPVAASGEPGLGLNGTLGLGPGVLAAAAAVRAGCADPYLATQRVISLS
jgi:hypothetical protein